MANAYQQNYTRLKNLLGQPPEDLPPESALRFRSSEWMDLVVEVLPRCQETSGVVMSLAHYFTQNGDLCSDPEMELRVIAPTAGRPGTVEALCFQQSIPPVYQLVYPKPGYVAPKVKRELNAFLSLWSRNLRSQGHQRVVEGS